MFLTNSGICAREPSGWVGAGGASGCGPQRGPVPVAQVHGEPSTVAIHLDLAEVLEVVQLTGGSGTQQQRAAA